MIIKAKTEKKPDRDDGKEKEKENGFKGDKSSAKRFVKGGRRDNEDNNEQDYQD